MKNLYEILEVSPKASEEVIEKAYKVLAKKYHPDLQPSEAQKKWCEQKMKALNEAYEILGDREKRKQYDAQIKEKEEAKSHTNEPTQRKTQTTYTEPPPPKAEQPESIYDIYGQVKYDRDTLKRQAERQEKMHAQQQSAYQYAYETYLKRLGFKVKKKWTWRRAKDLLKALGIMALIVLALWLFPPTRNGMISFYENNVIIKALVDFIGNFFQALVRRME